MRRADRARRGRFSRPYRRLPELDLAETSEFLVIASLLVELKSRRLLPGPDEVDADEELVGLEQRDLLLARLVELQAYSAVALDFGILIEQAARSLPRTAGLEEKFTDLAPDLLTGVGPQDIAAAFQARHRWHVLSRSSTSRTSPSSRSLSQRQSQSSRPSSQAVGRSPSGSSPHT